MNYHFDSYTINQYSREELIDTFKRIHKQFPAVFEHFFMEELRGQKHFISKKDAELLKGTPAPLKILVPVKIEE